MDYNENWFYDFKPSNELQIDFSSPLSNKLMACFPLFALGGKVKDIKNSFNVSGSCKYIHGIRGMSLNSASAVLFGTAVTNIYDIGSGPITIAFGMKASTQSIGCEKKLAGSPYTGWSLYSTFDRPTLRFTDNSTNEDFDTTDSHKANDGLYHTWICTARRDGGLSIWYKDGKIITTKTYARTASVDCQSQLNLGNSNSGTQLFFLYVYNRFLNYNEVKMLDKFPYSMFKAHSKHNDLRRWSSGTPPATGRLLEYPGMEGIRRGTLVGGMRG